MQESALSWWQQHFELLLNPTTWWQLLLLAVAAIAVSLVNRHIQKLLETQASASMRGFRHIAVRSLQRLLWPLIALAIVLPAKAVLDWYDLPIQLLSIAVPILSALALIRFCVYILRKAFTINPLLKSSESALTTIVWFGVVLHLLGWLPAVFHVLDSLAVHAGENRISVLSVLKLLLLVGLAFTLAIWLSELINNQLKRSAYLSPSMRVGFSKFTKFLLITLAFFLALNAVGINFSSLAIFGGALGVGLGFGLQRIASNFISGFILVFDRSIKPGDVITVGDKFGWVEALHSRYVVVRNRDGVDTLIPNENLITSEVINWSYADRNVRVYIKLHINYHHDPELAMTLMLESAFASDRVLQDPPPSTRLMAFTERGMELHLLVWINDPEHGIENVVADINLAIWRAFKEHGITIAYPQRDLHIKSMPTNMP